MFKYAFEAVVIISGILLSFYIEELRIERKNIKQKNEILVDLKYTAEDDLKQIILIFPHRRFHRSNRFFYSFPFP